MPTSVLREQDLSLMPGLGCLEKAKMERDWAVTELEEMMPEQSQAAAMAVTLEEKEVKAMCGSKHLPT